MVTTERRQRQDGGPGAASPTRGIAARAGAWSARHRWTAVIVWALFVVLAMGLGTAAGQVGVKNSEQMAGEVAMRHGSSRTRV